MANHLRRQIREVIGTALTGLTTTGARVFQSRIYPLQSAELPCLLISTGRESILVAGMNAIPRPLERVLQIRVDGIAQANSGLENTLDAICKEVEVALAMPLHALNAIADDITLQEIDEPELQGIADQPAGRVRLTFAVSYFAAENAPDVSLSQGV